MTRKKVIFLFIVAGLTLFAVLRGQRLQKKSYASVPNGIHLLDDRDLVLWNELSLKLCERSEEYCADLWDGEIAANEEARALSLLSHQELEEWDRLSKLSPLPALQGREEVSVKDFNLALRKLRLHLSNVDQERLNLAVHRGEKASREIAASAMKSLLRNSHLPPGLRERFIRYLATQRLKR